MLATFLTLQMLSTQPPVSNDKSACPYNWYAVLCYVSVFFAFDDCAPHHLFLFGCLSTGFLLRRYPLSFQFSLFPFFLLCCCLCKAYRCGGGIVCMETYVNINIIISINILNKKNPPSGEIHNSIQKRHRMQRPAAKLKCICR